MWKFYEWKIKNDNEKDEQSMFFFFFNSVLSGRLLD